MNRLAARLCATGARTAGVVSTLAGLVAETAEWSAVVLRNGVDEFTRAHERAHNTPRYR